MQHIYFVNRLTFLSTPILLQCRFPNSPLELLLMIAHHIRDDHGEIPYGDFNSFLQINRALYVSLNRKLWKEVAEHQVGTQRALTHLIKTNDFPGARRRRLKSVFQPSTWLT
jgi:hypothetical protein